MFLWDQAINSDVLVSKETIEQAFTPGELNNGEKIKYGYGWYLDELHGGKVVHHGGGTSGFNNLILKIPELNYSSVILTNRNDLDLNLPAGYDGVYDLERYIVEKTFPDITTK